MGGVAQRNVGAPTPVWPPGKVHIDVRARAERAAPRRPAAPARELAMPSASVCFLTTREVFLRGHAATAWAATGARSATNKRSESYRDYTPPHRC